MSDWFQSRSEVSIRMDSTSRTYDERGLFWKGYQGISPSGKLPEWGTKSIGINHAHG